VRKIIVIFGTLLIAAVFIISGSAVAPYVHYIDEDYTTDIYKIDGAPDDSYASIGKYIPPATYELGWVWLELNLSDEMGPSQDFTVYAGYVDGSEETYNVYVGETRDVEGLAYVGQGNDTSDEIFTTPSQPFNAEWRYIFIEGVTGAYTPDPAYGPDLDAVGWT
jgi:hypothetical protein